MWVLSLGNLGQRIPDYDFAALRYKFIQTVLKLEHDADSWEICRKFSLPLDDFKGLAAIEAVTADNLREVVMTVYFSLEERRERLRLV